MKTNEKERKEDKTSQNKKKHYKEQRKMQNILNYELEKLSLIIKRKKTPTRKNHKNLLI